MHLHAVSQGVFQKEMIVHQDLKPDNILVDRFEDGWNYRSMQPVLASVIGATSELQVLTRSNHPM